MNQKMHDVWRTSGGKADSLHGGPRRWLISSAPRRPTRSCAVTILVSKPAVFETKGSLIHRLISISLLFETKDMLTR